MLGSCGADALPGSVTCAGLSGGAPGSCGGALAHAPSTPKIASAARCRDAARCFSERVKPVTNREKFAMWALLLEAFGVLLIAILIVWWTMFSGRKNGERRVDSDAEK